MPQTLSATKAELTAEQIKQYHDEGFTTARGLFTDAELDELESEFDGIIERRSAANAQLDATWDAQPVGNTNIKPVIAHTHDVQAYSAAWTRVLVHDRLTQSMADLIGPNVQLHHTKLFMKPTERGSGFPLHQDAPYFRHANHTMMAAVIHLTDATEEMGCIRVIPASHKNGELPLAKKPDGTVRGLFLDPQEYPVDSAMPVVCQRGDVIYFNYHTIHGSGLNLSDRIRKTVLIQVRDPTDSPTEKNHLSHAQGLMMRGINPLTHGSNAVGVLDDTVIVKSPTAIDAETLPT